MSLKTLSPAFRNKSTAEHFCCGNTLTLLINLE